MDINMKEVDYATYCKGCKYFNLSSTEEPCNGCLEESVRKNTIRPLNWEKWEKK